MKYYVTDWKNHVRIGTATTIKEAGRLARQYLRKAPDDSDVSVDTERTAEERYTYDK